MGALRDLIGLLPRGAAWSTSPDSNLGRLLAGLAAAFDRVEARAADLQREAFPLTADELLREWDAAVALGYPGALTGGFDKDLARAMIAWLLETRTLSRSSIERFCALSEIPFAADGDGVTRPLYRLLGVEHTDTHEATIRLLVEGGGSSFVEDVLRRRAHATGTLVFDWVVPAIEITSPADEALACDELVTVTGTSTGVGSVRVTVTEAGGLVTHYDTDADPGDGDWAVQVVLSSELDGEDATIVARGYTGIVTAGAGWVESDPVVVTSSFGVVVSFTGPLTTTEGQPTLTGTATPGSTIVIELRGDQELPVVADVNGDWSVEMENQNLELGVNEITIFVTGPAPCEHEDSIVVEVELEAGSGVPVNTAPPVVSGTIEIGEVLSCTTGSWTNSPTSYAYQWQRDGVDIGGATASTHTVVDEDIGPGTGGVGTGVRCVVTPTNGSGSGTPAASNALAFNHAAYLPNTAIGVSTAGLTLADSDTTVDSWAATLGGVSATLTAPTSGQRPAYSASGGPGSRPLVTGDGSNDALMGTLTKGSAWDSYEWGAVCRLVSAGSAGERVVCYGVGATWWSSGAVSRFHLNERNAGTYRVTVSGGANVEPLLDSSSALLHWSADASSGTINARRGGTVEATASATVTSRPDGETLSLFADGAGGSNSNSAMLAWYCGPVLTADQRTHLRALLTYHTGVAC